MIKIGKYGNKYGTKIREVWCKVGRQKWHRRKKARKIINVIFTMFNESCMENRKNDNRKSMTGVQAGEYAILITVSEMNYKSYFSQI